MCGVRARKRRHLQPQKCKKRTVTTCRVGNKTQLRRVHVSALHLVISGKKFGFSIERQCHQIVDCIQMDRNLWDVGEVYYERCGPFLHKSSTTLSLDSYVMLYRVLINTAISDPSMNTMAKTGGCVQTHMRHSPHKTTAKS